VQEPRQLGVTLMLAAELLHLGGLAPNVLAGRRMAQAALDSGQAAERFARMVAALGGPADVLQQAALPLAPLQVQVPALRGGFVSHVDVRALGLLVVALGGGRARPGDAVDPRVGLAAVQPLGAAIRTGQSLAVLHAAHVRDVQAAVLAVQQAITIGEQPPELMPAVLASVG
jgi:thymidine phosphorylase